MNSAVVLSGAILLFIGLSVSTSNADLRVLRKRSVEQPSERSLSQELSRELRSLQYELEELPHLRVTRNATEVTDPAVPGAGASSGIARIFRFFVQAALIIPRGALSIGITLLGIASRLTTGFLNGVQSSLSTILSWLNSI